MATQTLIAKITKKAKNGKGFLLEGNENWFNASEKVAPFLAKIAEGKVVEVSYFKKGVNQTVTLIKEVGGSPQTSTQEAPKEEGKYTHCAICNKELTGKGVNYPNCWDCKDKAPATKTNTETSGYVNEPGTQKPPSRYDNTNKDVQIQRGNSLNSASAVLKGNFEGTNTDIETIKQATLNLAESFLDWLRLE